MTRGPALCLDALAWVSAARGSFRRAATLQGASLSIWESIPGQLPGPLEPDARHCELLTIDALGQATRERLVDAGRQLDRREAVAFALDEPAPDAPPQTAHRRTSTLSKRELEVAALIAEGKTDREIARRLVISQRTAESHVQHILAKLGFRSRVQVAGWMVKR